MPSESSEEAPHVWPWNRQYLLQLKHFSHCFFFGLFVHYLCLHNIVSQQLQTYVGWDATKTIQRWNGLKWINLCTLAVSGCQLWVWRSWLDWWIFHKWWFVFVLPQEGRATVNQDTRLDNRVIDLRVSWSHSSASTVFEKHLATHSVLCLMEAKVLPTVGCWSAITVWFHPQLYHTGMLNKIFIPWGFSKSPSDVWGESMTHWNQQCSTFN